MYGNDVMGAALDRHITGNWGWDYDKGGTVFNRGYEEPCEDCPFCATIVDECGTSYECENNKECEYEDNSLDFAAQEERDAEYAYDLWVDREVERNLLDGE